MNGLYIFYDFFSWPCLRILLYKIKVSNKIYRSSLDLKVVVKKYYLKKSSLMTNVESSFEKKHGFCFLYVACFLLPFFLYVFLKDG